MRKFVPVFVVVLAVGCIPTNSTPQGQADPAPAPSQASTPQAQQQTGKGQRPAYAPEEVIVPKQRPGLYGEYMENAVRAELAYQGKLVRITGQVLRVGKSDKGPWVFLMTYSDQRDARGTYCVMPAEDVARVSQFNRVTIVGRVQGYNTETEKLVLTDCKLLLVEGPGAGGFKEVYRAE